MSVQKQFGHFSGMVMQNMPELHPVHMQGWVEDPEGLKEVLSNLNKGKHLKEKDGYVSFLLPVTDGTKGKEWVHRLKGEGHSMLEPCEQLLLSPDFKPTTGVVYKVRALKAKSFPDHGRSTENIKEMAAWQRLGKLNAEAACLMCENFTSKEMQAFGLNYIVVMSDLIGHCKGLEPAYLAALHQIGGPRLMFFCDGSGKREWSPDGLFAFRDES